MSSSCPDRSRIGFPTVQDLLKLNKVIRAAKVIESKIKIRSTPVEHFLFVGVHDAAHANLVTAGSSHSCSTCKYHECVPVSVLSWQSKKIKRVVRSSFAAETITDWFGFWLG